MAVRALLIGCGSIGGLADIESDRVLTWAKALARRPEVELDVYDANADNARRVAERHGLNALPDIPWQGTANYDLAIVATPTPSHAGMLSRLFETGPPTIVCEKPVAATNAELDDLESRYRGQNRRVMVNFHRRFQPSMSALRQRIAEIETRERCTSIVVTYQRGLHNNGSHALDLLEYLFGRRVNFEDAVVTGSRADEFADDPTISLGATWSGSHLLWQGLIGLRASVLDIAIYFEHSAIQLTQGCDTVRFLSAPATTAPPYAMLVESHVEHGAMKDHMTHVADHVLHLVQDPTIPDNFLSSINISRRLVGLQKAP